LQRFRPALHFELYQGLATDSAARGKRILAMLQSFGYSFYREGTLEPVASSEAVLAELRPGRNAVNVVALAR
jgi:hypothetical protein